MKVRKLPFMEQGPLMMPPVWVYPEFYERLGEYPMVGPGEVIYVETTPGTEDAISYEQFQRAKAALNQCLN